MQKLKFIILLFSLAWINSTSFCQRLNRIDNMVKTAADVKVGAQHTHDYLPLIKNKAVAVVGNHTSLINKTHLVDSLISLHVNVKKIFCPEHGFRGEADAGEKVSDGKDAKTGLPLISLYGKTKKPSAEMLKDVEVVVFDIQDVGVRCYTYLSSLAYVMEACAENNKKLIVLDRPNPNSYYIDGPILEDGYKSYVGLHPVPLVYAMTLGEYAGMINGEGWLPNKMKCDVIVIPVSNYQHSDLYELPVKPSPNLPNMSSVYLYPSLVLFEGTVVSVGRGTDKPFQVIGHPKLQNAKYNFTPKPTLGAKDPPYNGQLCYGFDLSNFGNMFIKNSHAIYLYWLIGTYKNTIDKTTYFNDFFNKLAGNATLQQQIKDGLTEEQIHKSWEPGLKAFKPIRKKYLLYPDFE